MNFFQKRRCGVTRDRSRGQVLPFVAIAMFAIFGMLTLAIDVGYYRYQQRLQQTAADSAAIAGAIAQLTTGATSSAITAAGRKDATSNGFTDDGGATISVTLNNPPTTGGYTANSLAVEAIVLKQQPKFFGGIFGGGTQPLTTRAVAAPSAAGRGCVYALGVPGKGKSTPSGITINGGSGGFLATSCNVVSNADFTANGNGVVNALGIGYYGTGPKGGSYPSGQPTQLTVQATDPCATVPGCAYLTANPPTIAGTNTYAAPTVSGTTTTYYPGEYRQVLKPSGTTVFSPGLYVFDNGFDSSGSTQITGTGVTFYNGAYPTASGGGSITIGGNTNLSITAPTSGNYNGVALFQPTSNTNDFVFNGAAGADGFVGAIYLPGAQLKLNGNLPKVSLVVAGGITVDGGGITVTAGNSPSGLEHFVLVE